MTSSAQFKKNVQHGGLAGKFKSPGRIAFITAALEAYEQSLTQNLPSIQQISYLYEVHKQCKKWLATKINKTSAKSLTRQMYVTVLMQEVPGEMSTRFPDLWRALTTFEQNKAQGAFNQTTGTKGVYAHESSLYQQNKAEGKFSAPAAPRLTGSATLFDTQGVLGQLQGRSHQQHKAFVKSSLAAPVGNGLSFHQFTGAQFRELDKICLGQFNVLYLSKIQRLQYMVIVENGLMKHPDGKLITLLSGMTVKDEIESCPYAADKYGNLFVTAERDHQGQINHTTLCAGAEVLCAGTMSIKNGELRAITNTSGHYKPDTTNLTNVLNILLDAGVPMANVLVIDAAQGQLVTTANPFMAANYKPMISSRANLLLGKTA